MLAQKFILIFVFLTQSIYAMDNVSICSDSSTDTVDVDLFQPLPELSLSLQAAVPSPRASAPAYNGSQPGWLPQRTFPQAVVPSPMAFVPAYNGSQPGCSLESRNLTHADNKLQKCSMDVLRCYKRCSNRFLPIHENYCNDNCSLSDLFGAPCCFLLAGSSKVLDNCMSHDGKTCNHPCCTLKCAHGVGDELCKCCLSTSASSVVYPVAAAGGLFIFAVGCCLSIACDDDC